MYSTFVDAITTRTNANFRVAERIGAVVFITALTAMAAQISIPLPFTPVPFTFQPMVVLVGARHSDRASGRRVRFCIWRLASPACRCLRCRPRCRKARRGFWVQPAAI